MSLTFLLRESVMMTKPSLSNSRNSTFLELTLEFLWYRISWIYISLLHKISLSYTYGKETVARQQTSINPVWNFFASSRHILKRSTGLSTGSIRAKPTQLLVAAISFVKYVWISSAKCCTRWKVFLQILYWRSF